MKHDEVYAEYLKSKQFPRKNIMCATETPTARSWRLVNQANSYVNYPIKNYGTEKPPFRAMGEMKPDDEVNPNPINPNPIDPNPNNPNVISQNPINSNPANPNPINPNPINPNPIDPNPPNPNVISTNPINPNPINPNPIDSNQINPVVPSCNGVPEPDIEKEDKPSCNEGKTIPPTDSPGSPGVPSAGTSGTMITDVNGELINHVTPPNTNPNPTVIDNGTEIPNTGTLVTTIVDINGEVIPTDLNNVSTPPNNLNPTLIENGTQSPNTGTLVPTNGDTNGEIIHPNLNHVSTPPNNLNPTLIENGTQSPTGTLVPTNGDTNGEIIHPNLNNVSTPPNINQNPTLTENGTESPNTGTLVTTKVSPNGEIIPDLNNISTPGTISEDTSAPNTEILDKNGNHLVQPPGHEINIIHVVNATIRLPTPVSQTNQRNKNNKVFRDEYGNKYVMEEKTPHIPPGNGSKYGADGLFLYEVNNKTKENKKINHDQVFHDGKGGYFVKQNNGVFVYPIKGTKCKAKGKGSATNPASPDGATDTQSQYAVTNSQPPDVVNPQPPNVVSNTQPPYVVVSTQSTLIIITSTQPPPVVQRPSDGLTSHYATTGEDSDGEECDCEEIEETNNFSDSTGIGTAGNVGVGTAGNVGVGTAGNVGVGTAGNVEVGTNGNKGIGTNGNTGIATDGETGVVNTNISNTKRRETETSPEGGTGSSDDTSLTPATNEETTLPTPGNNDEVACTNPEDPSCICSLDGVIDDFAKMANDNPKEFLVDVEKYKCSRYVTKMEQFTLTNEAKPRTSRSVSRSIFGRHGRAVASNESTVAPQINVTTDVLSTDFHKYATVGSYVEMTCLSMDQMVKLGTNVLTFHWLDSKKKELKAGHFQEAPDGRLVINGVTVNDEGKYTCTVRYSNPDTYEEEEKNFPHQLTVIGLPKYFVRGKIQYAVSSKCDPEDMEIWKMFMPDLMKHWFCSNKKSMCRVDINNPLCFSDEKSPNTLIVSLIVHISDVFSMLPPVDDKICDLTCREKVEDKFVKIVHANLIKVVNTPVLCRLSYRSVDYTPMPETIHVDLMEGCQAGMQLQDKFCYPCPQDSYGPEEGAFCLKCERATYQPQPGSSSCKPCPNMFVGGNCLTMYESSFPTYAVLFGVIILLLVLCCLICIWMRFKKRQRQKEIEKKVKEDSEKGIKHKVETRKSLGGETRKSFGGETSASDAEPPEPRRKSKDSKHSQIDLKDKKKSKEVLIDPNTSEESDATKALENEEDKPPKKKKLWEKISDQFSVCTKMKKKKRKSVEEGRKSSKDLVEEGKPLLETEGETDDSMPPPVPERRSSNKTRKRHGRPKRGSTEGPKPPPVDFEV